MVLDVDVDWLRVLLLPAVYVGEHEVSAEHVAHHAQLLPQLDQPVMLCLVMLLHLHTSTAQSYQNFLSSGSHWLLTWHLILKTEFQVSLNSSYKRENHKMLLDKYQPTLKRSFDDPPMMVKSSL